ncbi:toprim domain-containing protein [Nocardia sp. IFM 10818]
MDSRGLLDPDNPQLLGYVEAPLPGHDHFAGMISIPYLRRLPGGRLTVVSIRFRCAAAECEHKGHGKYMTEPGDRPRLYNTPDLLVPAKRIAITEGEFDAIAAHEAGVPAVGVPGSTSWQSWFREPFLGYEVVYILADGDDPGRKFAGSIAKQLPNARIVQYPKGHDTNSFVQEHGADALLERIS